MKRFLIAAIAALLVSPALAGEHDGMDHKGMDAMADPAPATVGALTVSAPKARVTIPSRPAAAYFSVANAGGADRLVAASSPAFGRVELHTHLHQDGVMKMMKVEAIDVPAEGEAALAPGGDHVMLFDAVEPLKIGDSFPLTLTFEKAGDVEIMVPVKPIQPAGHNAMGGGMNHDAMKGH